MAFSDYMNFTRTSIPKIMDKNHADAIIFLVKFINHLLLSRILFNQFDLAVRFDERPTNIFVFFGHCVPVSKAHLS